MGGETPKYLNEDEFTLDRGLRRLTGNYHSFNSASYIAILFLGKLEAAKELDEDASKKETEKIYDLAFHTTIGAWCGKCVELVTNRIYEEDIYCLDTLSEELRSTKDDFSMLAEKTSQLWNAFHDRGDLRPLRETYHDVMHTLNTIVLCRYLNKQDEYQIGLERLDMIYEEVLSRGKEE